MRTDDSLSIAVWPANSSGVTAFEMLPALWWSSDANTAAENDPPEPTTYSGLPTAFLVNSSRPPILGLFGPFIHTRHSIQFTQKRFAHPMTPHHARHRSIKI